MRDFEATLRAAGLDASLIRENAGTPAEAHARTLQQDPAPWLEPILTHVLRLAPLEGVSLWSVTHFVVPPLLNASGADSGAFARSLSLVTGTLETLHRQGERAGRFEQYAVRIAAHLTSPRLQVVLTMAQRLALDHVDPGWLVQLLAEPLAPLEDSHFELACQLVEPAVRALAKKGVHVGSPVSTGLAAMLGNAGAFTSRTVLAEWLDVLVPLLVAAGSRAYGLSEHSIPGLFAGELDASKLTEAMTLALTMLDHGLEPRPTLAQGLRTPLHLDIASRLAREGVDPFLVCTRGFAVFEELGWLADGGDRLVQLALEVHRNGHRVRLLFEDGLDVLPVLEREFGAQAMRGLELAEAMVHAGLDPGVTFRASLPRALSTVSRREGQSPTATEVLEFAHALVLEGIEPSAALSYALRPLAELSGGTSATFATLSRTVVSLVVRLKGLGVDHREILFHDVQALAEAGGHSRAFVELLTRVSTLLEDWSARGFDLSAILSEGVPHAARTSKGQPWALAAALDTAIRLGRENRPAEATVLLTTGFSTALTTAAGDETRFRQALGSVEGHFAQLPPGLAEKASQAAVVLAGTDVTRLEAALDVLVRAARRCGEEILVVASVLPALAECAERPQDLADLIDVTLRAHGSVAESWKSRWLDAGVALVSLTCRHQPAAAASLVRELAAWLTEAARCEVLQFAASIGRFAAPSRVVPLLERSRTALGTAEVRQALLPVLDFARDEATWLGMVDLLGPLLASPTVPAGFHAGLTRLRSALSGRPGLWARLIGPTVLTAKQHAGPLFDAFGALGHHLGAEEDWDMLRELVTQRGVRAADTLWNLVVPGVHQGTITSLAAHRDSLQRYLGEVGFADARVYAHYLSILQDASLTEALRRERISALTAEMATLTDSIRTGEVPAALEAHPLFFVALQHVFPPSVSATRQTYQRLYSMMSDRPGDVSGLGTFDNPTTLEVASGSYQLRSQSIERSAFVWLQACLPVEGAEPEPEALLGWELVSNWAEGRLAREPVKAPLIERLLRRVPVSERPTGALEAASQLQAVRALAADRLHGLVEDALLAARSEDPARFERLVRTKLAPPPRVGAGLVKSIGRTLEAARAGTLETAEAIRRLLGQLQAFEVSDATARSLLSTPTEDLRAALEELSARPVELEAAKEVHRVHGDLVGQHLQRMNEVLSGELEYLPSSDVLRLRLHVTKRKAHAVAGLTAGVCVVHDEALWNSPEFLHVVFWNESGVCQGGMHLLRVEDEGGRFLALPGINPTLALLEQVDAAVLLGALLDWASRLARACDLTGVWIPTSPSIHSNRHAVSKAIIDAGLEVRRVRSHPFSFSPYAYRFDEVFVARPTAATS